MLPENYESETSQARAALVRLGVICVCTCQLHRSEGIRAPVAHGPQMSISTNVHKCAMIFAGLVAARNPGSDPQIDLAGRAPFFMNMEREKSGIIHKIAKAPA